MTDYIYHGQDSMKYKHGFRFKTLGRFVHTFDDAFYYANMSHGLLDEITRELGTDQYRVSIHSAASEYNPLLGCWEHCGILEVETNTSIKDNLWLLNELQNDLIFG